MSDDQFTKLFRYMQDFHKDVDVQFGETKQEIDHLRSSIDAYAGKIDNYALEMVALDHKIQRLEKYIQVLAKKTGVDLEAINI